MDPMRALWEAGSQAWPGIELPEQEFREHVDSLQPGTGASADLYLAAACALGIEGAVEAFERQCIARVPAYIAHMNQPPDFTDEVQQRVRERLLVSRADAPLGIASYSGRGALHSWVCAVTMRIALNLRTRAPGPPVVHDETAVLAEAVKGDPELEVLKRRYAGEFQGALRAAFVFLLPEQRHVLHLYHIDRLTVPQIGALLRVHHTTIVRQLAAARRDILKQTKALLGERLGIDSAEFKSLLHLLYSQLDISIEGLLRGP